MQSDSNILQVDKLSKYFGGLGAVSNCSLKIKKGSITGIIGPNGSGKTTLFNILLGITKMDSGKLFINNDGKKNLNIGSLPIHQRCSENKIKFIPQYDSLFRNLNVEDNLRAVAEIFLKDRREIEEKIENL